MVETAVVLGRVGLRLMHGAGLQGCLVGNVLERHEAMSVATAERAEFGFVVGVYVDVDAFAVGFHNKCQLVWVSLVLKVVSFFGDIPIFHHFPLKLYLLNQFVEYIHRCFFILICL